MKQYQCDMEGLQENGLVVFTRGGWLRLKIITV